MNPRPMAADNSEQLEARPDPKVYRYCIKLSDTLYCFQMTSHNPWPELILEEWQDTLATLHMWTQIVGNIRLELTPLVNHWWNVPLYVSARGLTTSPIPYQDRIFEIEFDFIDHTLRMQCSDGSLATLDLRPQT